MNNYKTLYLFTHSFPYGQGEQFLCLELSVLATNFSKIIIIPSNIIGIKRDIFQSNAIIEVVKPSGNVKQLSIKNFFLLVEILIYEIIHSAQRIIYLKNLRYYISYLKNSILQAKILIASLGHRKEAIFYTYWFDEASFRLSILKRMGKIDKIITRAHGGDVYEYQHQQNNFIFPFRHYQIKWLDRICAISRDGYKHLKKTFKIIENKISFHHLATEDMGLGLNSKNTVFTILSCSTFFPYKRIPFLIAVLKHCKHKIKWIHIGDDGDEKEKCNSMIKDLPANIDVNWLGYLNHKEVMLYYTQQPIDLFLNVSSSEGIPVTLMEAISFGIPVMAPNVGGIAEIVTPDTGILLRPDYTETDVAALINQVIAGTLKMPKAELIRAFWIKNYSIKNYQKFYKELLCAV